MAHIVDVLVVHQREEPSAEIRAGLPEVLLNQRPNQRILDQVVGPLEISGKRPRIAAQPRNSALREDD